ncbi:MAG: HNH endonuclease, partial [Actinobacteria bacterium]|nr:HNH endonuclease [Actinomycetota bacterium]
MPTVSAWFADGSLSWPAVRAIVAATRNLTAEQRAWLDRTLAADAERVRRLDPDRVVTAVDRLVDQARPDLHTNREQRQFRGQRFSVQQRFDGSSHVTGEFDAEATATLLAGLEASVPGDDGDGGGDDDGQGQAGGADGDGRRRDKGRSNASRLITIIVAYLAGTPGGRARPSMIILTDAAALADTAGAAVAPDDWSSTAPLLWSTHRPRVELTAAAVQRLSCDVRHVLVDGADVLGVSAAHPAVSATLRAALIARDSGCRFPGCLAPVDQCENHHVTPISNGGPTTLENLALVCANHHHAIHDSGGRSTLAPDGTMTFTRRGVALTSQPRAARRINSTESPP